MFEVGKKYFHTDHEKNRTFICVSTVNNFGWLLENSTNFPGTFAFTTHWKEYREPIRVSGWVNVYPEMQFGLYKTEEDADRAAALNVRIACVYVSGEEGKEPSV